MIKVGQIYKERGTPSIWAITRCFSRGCSMINQDGEVTCGYIPYYFWEKLELIAEYPTWQEAINSKEFKVG